jgi:FixJ family two-component response regulator
MYVTADLSTWEITIKLHRGEVMHKMRAKSLAALARLAATRYETTYTNV